MKKIVCLGDSITDAGRLDTKDGLGRGYVKQLHKKLNPAHHEYELINRGVDGFVVERILNNLESDCIAKDPDYVTLLVGINDIGLMMNTNRTDAQKKDLAQQFQETYQTLVTRIRKETHASLILMEPFIFPYPQEYANWIPHVQQMSEFIGVLAEEQKLPYLRFHDIMNVQAQALSYAALTPDGIHLTDFGHSMLANKLYLYFEGYDVS